MLIEEACVPDSKTTSKPRKSEHLLMTTLLAVGDIHLGRLPAGLPGSLAARRRDLGPEAAWNRAVTEAVNRRVDAVLLAGDVVERSRDFFVAYGDLKAGVERLAKAEIPVLAVAGNHDTHVLPRLAAEIDSLELLGAGGQWQARKIDQVTVLGWSFPQIQVRSSPVPSLPQLDDSQFRIGLLHCDRDQSDSPYAPVTSAELADAPVDAWLLGHIHRPDALSGDRPIGYLGSISALRASETGDRGPWLIDINDRRIRCRQLVLAPLRYEHMPVDVSDIEAVGDCANLISSAARQQLQALAELESPPLAVGLRVVLTGRSSQAKAFPDMAEQLMVEATVWQEAGIDCFLDRIQVEVEPFANLDKLAIQTDPAGLLARRLLLLRGPQGPERQALIDHHRPQLAQLAEAREFALLEREIDDQAVAKALEQAALVALSRLLAQRELR